jgi:prepilin-type N-terminal cleavage/methylation domain-containing protein
VSPRPDRTRAGFTLAEVAVTLVIVGIGLLFVLQGLSTSKFTAAQTLNRKIALQLALSTLGEIQAGLFREDLDDDRLVGNYGEQGYEEWLWEVVFADESFSDELQEDGSLMFDTFRDRERRQREAEEDEDDDDDKDEDEDEETSEPYEKVRIRVSFPKLGDFPNTLTLERWMPWEDVYGPEEAAEGESPVEPPSEP